jgi:hypothetical protein
MLRGPAGSLVAVILPQNGEFSHVFLRAADGSQNNRSCKKRGSNYRHVGLTRLLAPDLGNAHGARQNGDVSIPPVEILLDRRPVSR